MGIFLVEVFTLSKMYQLGTHLNGKSSSSILLLFYFELPTYSYIGDPVAGIFFCWWWLTKEGLCLVKGEPNVTFQEYSANYIKLIHSEK